MNALPLGNTATNPANSDALAFTETDWGIDTVAVRFPIDPSTVDTEAALWTTGSIRTYRHGGGEVHYLKAVDDVGDGVVRVQLAPYPGTATLEFNAPRVAGMERPALLHPDALTSLVERLLERYATIFTPALVTVDLETGEVTGSPDWRAQVRVTRLDIARDFAVPVQLEPAFLAYIEDVRPRHGRSSSTYRSTGNGHTRTNHSSTQGCDRIYNKDVEMGIRGRADVRRWRFETQLRKARLKGLASLSAITVESTWSALEQRWSAMRLDRPMRAGCTVLVRLAVLERKEQRETMAYMGFQTLGKAQDHFSRRELTRIRSRMKGIGLSPKKPLSLQPAEMMHLSLQTGLPPRT